MKKENETASGTKRMERMMSICMPRRMAEQLLRLAEQRSISRSALIRLAIMQVYGNELMKFETQSIQ